MYTEFFEQGDLECDIIGRPSQDLFNRAKTKDMPKMQIGFIDFICLPVYDALSKQVPELKVDAIGRICLLGYSTHYASFPPPGPSVVTTGYNPRKPPSLGKHVRVRVQHEHDLPHQSSGQTCSRQAASCVCCMQHSLRHSRGGTTADSPSEACILSSRRRSNHRYHTQI